MKKPLYRIFAFGALALLWLFVWTWNGTWVQAASPQQEGPTPTPPAPLSSNPLEDDVTGQSVEGMVGAVEQANRDYGGATLWHGGVLGYDDGFRLAYQIGEKLPAFGLMTGQGDAFRLDVEHTAYLINFWAAWCGPCTAEFPLLIERHQDAENPYRVTFVNVWDDLYTAQQFLGDFPPDILTMTDEAGSLPEAYGVDFIPISILVDAQGTIQMIQLGPVNEQVLDFASALIASP